MSPEQDALKTPMTPAQYRKRDEILANCDICKARHKEGATNITILYEHSQHATSDGNE